jgi:Fe2+ transport system protein B
MNLELLAAVADVYSGAIRSTPLQLDYGPEIEGAVADLLPVISDRVGHRANPRWIALKLVEGDQTIAAALREHFGEIDLPVPFIPRGMEATS